MPIDPNPDTPMRKDVRQVAVLFIAGGALETAITGQFAGGMLIVILGVLALLVSHHGR